MKPTLNKLNVSAGELRAEAILTRVNALKQFSVNIQELSSLESSLMEPYEVQSFNMGSFCKKRWIR